MAQRVNVELIDDLDGNAASQSVTFGLDGVEYEIDLSDKNAEKLRAALSKYVAAGRRIGKVKSVTGRKAAASGPSAREVREWAKANGFEVPERGRVPEDVREAFKAANPAA